MNKIQVFKEYTQLSVILAAVNDAVFENTKIKRKMLKKYVKSIEELLNQ